MPAQAQLQQFSYMELDFSLGCSGNMDRECSVWDRQVALYVDCGAASGKVEIGRWINSFQRIGRWVSTVPFMPLLASPRGPATPATCNFSATVDNGDHWLSTLNIRFGLSPAPATMISIGASTAAATVDDPGAPTGQPTSVVPIVYPNNGQGFGGKSYNANRTIDIDVPSGTKRVGVAAIISGHGGCEFAATSHHFVVTDGGAKSLEVNTLEDRYFDRFMQVRCTCQSNQRPLL